MKPVPTGGRVSMFVLRGFLSEAECTALITRIEASHRPSTVVYGNGDDSYRTSSTCEFDTRDPVVNWLDGKLDRISGIPPRYGEALQGQRYAIGQEFKAHTDTFEPNDPETERHCAVAGQRTWTFLTYLNDVEAGGTTRFPALDKLIQPERGMLVCWNNLRPDGSPNPDTLHHAMKVRRGMKYVVTRWYRERAWR
ncbi:oxygenase [Novosphingobium sp. PC22D]|nr:2OG-Fe(II) oxygenase [Novosphingobium sp. PC22D]PEQ10859.1 oxygenase [Novosphingobium sp. PC22D]